MCRGRLTGVAGAGTLVSARAQQERLTWVSTGGARYGFAILRVLDVVLVNLSATRAGAYPADEIALAMLRLL